MSSERDFLAHIAQHLQLGALSDEPVMLKPGSVPVWRIDTTRGAFHVKAWLRHGEWEWLKRSLEGVAEIELAAARAGVDMPEPVALNERIDGFNVTVHRWCEGTTVQPGDDVAGWIGATLAKLHAIPPPKAGPDDALHAFYAAYPPDTWRAWVAEGADKGVAWADAADDQLPAILRANEIVAEGMALAQPVAGSHRDLLAQNVLVDGAARWLVDWDLAGPDFAWFETVRAAVEFGRAAVAGPAKSFEPDTSVAREVIAAYLRAGGSRGHGGYTAFTGTLGMALGRIGWGMWISLGHRESTAEERAFNEAYVGPALAKLQRRLTTLSELVRVVG